MKRVALFMVINNIWTLLVGISLTFSLPAQEHFQELFYAHPLPLKLEHQKEILELTALLSTETPSSQDTYYHHVKEVRDGGKYLVLEDDSLWCIGDGYRKVVESWKAQESLKISRKGSSTDTQLENIPRGQGAFGKLEKNPQSPTNPFILRFCNSMFDAHKDSKFVLSNGCIFQGPKTAWKVREKIFIFHTPQADQYILWNLNRNEFSSPWKLVGNEKLGSSESFFNIEKRLNKRVLGQQNVISTVSATLLNCIAGLHDPNLPIGVFLFLGPTGVGKTELAKTLAQELYNNPESLVRFDMSQFAAFNDYTRLIGSPPGYVNHEEGGQLTKALQRQPKAVVLLDEIEKAHPAIYKLFLPIFDEGYIVDSKNRKVLCNQALFILTGNIASNEIAHLFNKGESYDEVLRKIEPQIIATLSPELYNRVTTVVFSPLSPQCMENLVSQKLQEVIVRLKSQKNMHLIVDEKARNYLRTEGFHPVLGARPLKRLIQNKLMAALSFAIINEGIPEGSTITLSYSKQEDGWNINWHH